MQRECYVCGILLVFGIGSWRCLCDEIQAEIAKLNTEAEKRVRELRARLERLKKADEDDDDVLDDEEALQAEVDQLQAEINKRCATRETNGQLDAVVLVLTADPPVLRASIDGYLCRNKRVEQIDKSRAWNIDNICHVKEEKTILNTPAPSTSLSAHDYTPQGHWKPEDEEGEQGEAKTETVSAPAAAAAPAPAAPAPAAAAAATAPSSKPAASAASKPAASKPDQPKKPITDHDEIISYNDFVIGHEQILETFCELRDLEVSKEFLYKHGHILLHEHGQSYILLSCLEDEMNGKHERARRVCRQSQLLTHITELAQSMHRDPRDVVLAFFRRIEQPEYRQVFESSVEEFVDRIKKRAVQKRLEMAKQEHPLAPGQLDPQEVFESLPESIQDAFESQDVPALQRALASMGREEARYHMRRCVKAGLWVPQDPHEFDSDPEEEDAKQEA